ncbi:hypothetical protein AB0958_21975 [Streptomyces sp. NPDC006655]|uniref:hypothetical protein n=1 Tax=Streptomyces sp. NPDC006655 TaxID=3156898 RepID=UPI0034518E1D
MKRAFAVGLAGLVLSLTAGCGTADPLNNGDGGGPTASATAKPEGDSHYYPSVGKVTHRPKAKHHKSAG